MLSPDKRLTNLHTPISNADESHFKFRQKPLQIQTKAISNADKGTQPSLYTPISDPHERLTAWSSCTHVKPRLAA